MASYPNAIKTFTTLQDGIDTILAQHPNERGDEITAMQTEVGTNPKGLYADLKTRLLAGLIRSITKATLSSAYTVTSSWGDIGLSVAITPKSTDSRFLVYFAGPIGDPGNNDNTDWGVRLVRDASTIHTVNALGSTAQGRAASSVAACIAYDGPSTVASVTYKIQAIGTPTAAFRIPASGGAAGQGDAVLIAVEVGL